MIASLIPYCNLSRCMSYCPHLSPVSYPDISHETIYHTNHIQSRPGPSQKENFRVSKVYINYTTHRLLHSCSSYLLEYYIQNFFTNFDPRIIIHQLLHHLACLQANSRLGHSQIYFSLFFFVYSFFSFHLRSLTTVSIMVFSTFYCHTAAALRHFQIIHP